MGHVDDYGENICCRTPVATNRVRMPKAYISRLAAQYVHAQILPACTRMSQSDIPQRGSRKRTSSNAAHDPLRLTTCSRPRERRHLTCHDFTCERASKRVLGPYLLILLRDSAQRRIHALDDEVMCKIIGHIRNFHVQRVARICRNVLMRWYTIPAGRCCARATGRARVQPWRARARRVAEARWGHGQARRRP